MQMNYSQINVHLVADSASINLPPPVDSCSVQRHKPYYGWISSANNDECVYLTPAIKLSLPINELKP